MRKKVEAEEVICFEWTCPNCYKVQLLSEDLRGSYVTKACEGCGLEYLVWRAAKP